MNDALKIVLSLSLSGSILILILHLLRPLYKDRLSKRWQYYIWLVVIARLLLPFAPETNLMGTLFQEIDKGMEQVEFVIPPSQGVSDDGTHQSGHMENGRLAPTAPVINPAQNYLVVALQNLWLVWLVIALILFIRKITIYQGFVKYIRAGCKEVVDIDLLERFGKLVEQRKIRNAVELYTNNLISSPLLIGFFRPCIVLPSTELPPADFEYTIRHELTHYKRRDMFYKWLVQFTVCVHWFNPLVYLMSREVGRACELSCDEAVIKALEPQERRAYGDTLLNAIRAGGVYKESLASVTLSESKERLKERLDAIMKFKDKSKIITVIAVVITILFSTSAMVAGAYANTENTSGPTPIVNYDVVTSERDLDSADMYINIKSAAVEVLPATDQKITAEYNSEVYTVEISESETNKWIIGITSKIGNNIGNNPVKLYLPTMDYELISLNIESASFDCGAISSGNIVSTINTSSTHFVLPTGFSGSFTANVTDGYFELSSKDGYANSTVVVSGNITVPDYFIQDGDVSTYSNGSKENMIEITAIGGYSKIE